MSEIEDESSAIQHEESVENSQMDSMAVNKEEPISFHPNPQNIVDEMQHSFLMDPLACLPSNSEAAAIGGLIDNVNGLIQEETAKVQLFQKKIHFWEEWIEKNNTSIAVFDTKVNQNSAEMVLDKKNRDYWFGRAEEVAIDYSYAEAGGHLDNWVWLIKKYGLKNSDGALINPREKAVKEICSGASAGLAGEYKNAGNKYEQIRNGRKMENYQLIRDGSHLKQVNATLKGYISAICIKEIEPLEEGIVLLKELNTKLQALSQDSKTTFGDLRAWAELFINDFLKTNSHVPQSVITDFRNLTSIPLPAQNS